MFSLGRIRLSSKTRFSVQLTEPSWSDVSVARFVAASKPTPLVSQFLVEFTDDTALGLNDDVSSLDLIILPPFLTTLSGNFLQQTYDNDTQQSAPLPPPPLQSVKRAV